jgi:hypothetical protein
MYVCIYVCMYMYVGTGITGWNDGVLAEALAKTGLGQEQPVQTSHPGRRRHHATAGSIYIHDHKQICMYVWTICMYVCVCMWWFVGE